MKKENFKLLNNPKVIKWCYEPITAFSLLNTSNKDNLAMAKKEEDLWGNEIIGTKNNVQWTTKLCQDLVMEALICLKRKNVKKAGAMQSSVRDKNYEPDLECEDYIYEVKSRNWSTPGTAGEKILGVPLKYGELPNLYKKPLQIVLVGYQEYEARKGFAFGDLLKKETQTKELQESLAFYKEHEIEYVAFTDILEKIGFPNGCWN
ncbi:hypothetical protein A3H53_04785 [Candidatus Nomurabacteria bacterium RIFCSPLOWO2_02_FULL_40_10]|uniref:Restriction endonuclease n=2 Tax=Candidatus Nomuraibacteriota TaxID=1752729 RepID=A0A1F6XY41_9BACT|nr:MAG: hypothetical protein A2642_00755 [Candidatus Nomurabacteria bacterium RIFCSPHIGHO2_01_FULL_39_10]OGI99040.1 MAG: hypothetical protein A3H53_04785 [Candidatus Nomurabacteria bacterium RIFCSPLOWO2_02_FULL_40_10]